MSVLLLARLGGASDGPGELVGLCSVLERGEDVRVRTSLDAVNKVGHFGEERVVVLELLWGGVWWRGDQSMKSVLRSVGVSNRQPRQA
jgi:hypothetical protein